MKTKNFLKVLGVLIAVALLLAVLPQQAKAQGGGNTLNVANWTGPTPLANVSGRETVLKDGDTYHMWYSKVQKFRFPEQETDLMSVQLPQFLIVKSRKQIKQVNRTSSD